MITRRNLAAAALAGAALALVGCSGSGGAAGGAKVVLLLSTLNNPFFVDVRDGALEAAKAAGLNLEVSDAQNDSATQANQAANAQAGGAKVVIINPVDSKAAGPAVAPLVSAKVPVIALDRAVEGAEVTSFIASDNVAGGAQAAEALAKALGEKGNVIVLQGVPGTSASNDRGKGFSEKIASYPGIKVVAKQTANFDRAQALDVTTNLLQANPGVVGIFAENDEMALGAIQALGARAGTEVKVFGFDGTEDGLKAVKAGTLSGTIAQQPKELGKKAVEFAAKAAEGQPLSALAPVPVTTITSENVAEHLK
ncbi:MAG: substrate-binding domain-containing protein [Propionibacteriaceae bacterium]|nr:substrate-binding domain-containing protein [Propionibacteriaceae bacterium]